MWLNREEENRVVLLLFFCYTWKFREWFALLFALLVIPILAHTCWVRTFLCLSREITIHYTIGLIPNVFLPYTQVSNCYLVTIFFIPIIREKFEFTLHAHSWSFGNIIVLCRLSSVHDSAFPQQELARISNFLHSSSFMSRFGTVGLGHYVWVVPNYIIFLLLPKRSYGVIPFLITTMLTITMFCQKRKYKN